VRQGPRQGLFRHCFLGDRVARKCRPAAGAQGGAAVSRRCPRGGSRVWGRALPKLTGESCLGIKRNSARQLPEREAALQCLGNAREVRPGQLSDAKLTLFVLMSRTRRVKATYLHACTMAPSSAAHVSGLMFRMNNLCARNELRCPSLHQCCHSRCAVIPLIDIHVHPGGQAQGRELPVVLAGGPRGLRAPGRQVRRHHRPLRGRRRRRRLRRFHGEQSPTMKWFQAQSGMHHEFLYSLRDQGPGMAVSVPVQVVLR